MWRVPRPVLGDVPSGVNPTFWRLVVEESLTDKTVVDVGTGAGRVALALAPLARQVVGIDRDEALVREGRQRAGEAGFRNVQLVVADADALADLRQPVAGVVIAPDLVVSHLFLSDRLVALAARALPARGAFVAAGLHIDQWRETGRPSRFAYDETRIRRLLADHGLAVEHLDVDRDVQHFPSVEAALAAAVGLEERWRADGRWFRYIAFLEEGGRTLTRAHLVVKARRP